MPSTRPTLVPQMYLRGEEADEEVEQVDAEPVGDDVEGVEVEDARQVQRQQRQRQQPAPVHVDRRPVQQVLPLAKFTGPQLGQLGAPESARAVRRGADRSAGLLGTHRRMDAVTRATNGGSVRLCESPCMVACVFLPESSRAVGSSGGQTPSWILV